MTDLGISDGVTPPNKQGRSPVTVTDLGNGNAKETLPKVKMMMGSTQEGASPKFPAEPMVTVACSGEALQEPIQKERCVYLAENVGDGIYR